MPRTFLQIIALLGLSVSALGQANAQANSADNHTLQALLSEVRALRQELRATLNKAQGMQVLLARFQIQEGVITRAGDRLNQARQQLLDTETHQKELGLEQKRIEDSLPATDPQEQSDLTDRLNHVKSGLEVTELQAQQRQAEETQAERQFRDEQDKLNALENRLDELTANTDDAKGKPETNRP